ncbi:homeobox-leucine zipper protein HDG7-like [Hordeum vulgare subsp. vulgare]|uniref:Homeobox domain-containing protein n=1 Tax=Hordeum vulgare subsp. vulgare TaxID=112509 RepID=A0A8I6WAR5_HORVV|nr:homeobox-leucine zipper protein HDG7-like [Hordeum vulgare subsp. vulgare]
MNGEWPQHNSDVHNDLDLFMTSEHSRLFQHDHGDEIYGLLGATSNAGNIDNANNVVVDQGNNIGETHSEQRMMRRRAHYHRLRGEQLQQLEVVFQEFPYPNEKLRKTLGERLGMSAQQVKFWFQNHRTSCKGKRQRREINNLHLENEMLKSERQAIISAMQNSTCLKCRGAMVQSSDISERQRLFIENMKLKEELLLATTHLKDGLHRNGMWSLLTRN